MAETIHTSLRPAEIAGYAASVLMSRLLQALRESGEAGEAVARNAVAAALADMEQPDADGTVPQDNVVTEVFIRRNFPSLISPKL